MRTKKIYIGNIKQVTGVHFLSSNDKTVFSEIVHKSLVYIKKGNYYNIFTKNCYMIENNPNLQKGDYFLDTKSLKTFKEYYEFMSRNDTTKILTKENILRTFRDLKEDR